jgi:hypothetical protein
MLTQLTENLIVWELWYFKAVASYRGERFQIPTHQTGEYKVDLTRHLKLNTFELKYTSVYHFKMFLIDFNLKNSNIRIV